MSASDLLGHYRLMVRMRAFENACLEGVPTGEIHGELHTSIGQEAAAAGLAVWLEPGDALVSTHRNHYHALAKGVSPRALLAEIFERETGLCGGRGGHMHPFDPEHNFSATGIVGASLPVALGYAYAFAMEHEDRIAVGVVGDGATNHGTFHECLNMAGAWTLPFVVVIENNGLGISVGIADVLATETIAERADAYGARAEVVDGTDVEVVCAAIERTLRHAREGGGPAVLEVVCARFQGHYEGDLEGYRPLAERDRIRRELDPVSRARAALLERAEIDEARLAEIETEAREEMAGLLKSVRLDPMPDAAGALDGIFVTP